MCWLSRPILLRWTATMRGTESTSSPECRSAEWSTNWGCFLEPNLLRVVMTNVWIAWSDLFECRLAWWSTMQLDVIRRAHFEWLRSQGEIRLTSLLQQWFSSVKCNPVCIFLFSVLQEKQIKNVVCELMAASNELKNLALIPNVVDAEAWTTSMLKNDECNC